MSKSSSEIEKILIELDRGEYLGHGGTALAKEKVLAILESAKREAVIEENESMKSAVTAGYTINNRDYCHLHDHYVAQCHACKEAKWGNIFCKKFEAIIDERLAELNQPREESK